MWPVKGFGRRHVAPGGVYEDVYAAPAVQQRVTGGFELLPIQDVGRQS